MDLSLRWLSDYVDISDKSPKEFCDALTLSGSKVEGYTLEGSEISNVVVGKVLEMERHPDSDHLWVMQIDVGEEAPIQIVTGAQNVVVGAKVPVAKDGSTLPGGVKIKKGKLRGVVSNGMMCGLEELGLTAHDFPYAIEDGIFLIEEDCEVGQDLKSAIGLNDCSVEFEITSNRPDCLSVLGLARETAATYGIPLHEHKPVVKGCGGDINDYLRVSVEDPELCPRYIARVVKNVKIGPSPRWMRERLRASGVRPINNLVDITNYVMLEYGQPMHAFDLRYVNGNAITVRRAANGETMMTLDGTERSFTDDMLIIADEKGPVAVAGVMGGEFSGIMDDTTTVVFESANFKGSSVRKTAQKLGMRTDASSRFEKGIKAGSCDVCVERACELVELLGCGEVVDGVIDVDHSDHTEPLVPFTPDWINRFLGISVPEEQMKTYLEALGLHVDENGMIHVPYWRIDIEHKADVAEEIARLYGYDHIPTGMMEGMARGMVTKEQKFENNIHEMMRAMGCDEIMTYSFLSAKAYDKILMPKDSPLRRSVTILNPLGEDSSIMRTTTIPSVLDIVSGNYNNRNPKFHCYEIGREYLPVEGEALPLEDKVLTIALYGNDTDFYTLKGMVDTLLASLGIADADIEPTSEITTFHPGRTAVYTKNGVEIGMLGEIHPTVCKNYSIGTKVYLAKLRTAVLFELSNSDKVYQAMPKFPAATRDLSLICDRDLPVIQIEKVIRKAVGNLLEKVALFDVYQGEQIGADQKSVAYSIVMRSKKSTLTDEEADRAINKVLKQLEPMGVTLRQ